MTQLTKNLKKKKGFTLVEVIIVLVILAILAAILIPSLVGYIDKANEKASIANCRSFVMAAQTIGSETYGEKGAIVKDGTNANIKEKDFLDEIFALSELDQNKYKATVEMSSKGKLSEVKFDDGSYIVTFNGSNYEVADTYSALSGSSLVIK